MDWEPEVEPPSPDGSPVAAQRNEERDPIAAQYDRYKERTKRVRLCRQICEMDVEVPLDAEQEKSAAPSTAHEPAQGEGTREGDNEAELAYVMQFVRDAATAPLCRTDASARVLCRDNVIQHLPVPRATEEEMLHSVGKNRTDRVCMNTQYRESKCVANALWPEIEDLKMAAAQLRRETEQKASKIAPSRLPRMPNATSAEKSNSHAIGPGMEKDSEVVLQPCLLCLRYRVQCEAYGVIQDGCGSSSGMIISTHHNLIDVPGEYVAEDCVLPQTPHNGVIGGCVMVCKSKLKPVRSPCGKYWKIQQLDVSVTVPTWTYGTKWRRPRCVKAHVETAFVKYLIECPLWTNIEPRRRRGALFANLEDCVHLLTLTEVALLGESLRWADVEAAFPRGHRRTAIDGQRFLDLVSQSGDWSSYRILAILLWRVRVLHRYNKDRTLPYHAREWDNSTCGGDRDDETVAPDLGCNADVAVSCYENKHLPIMWYLTTAPCLSALTDVELLAPKRVRGVEDEGGYGGGETTVATAYEPEWQRDFGTYEGPALHLPMQLLMTSSFAVDRAPKLELKKCKPHMKSQSVHLVIALIFRKCVGQRCLPKDVAAACVRESERNGVVRQFLSEAFLRFFLAPEARHVTASLDALRYGTAEKLSLWAHIGTTHGYEDRACTRVHDLCKQLASGGGAVLFLLVLRQLMHVPLVDEPALLRAMQTCCKWDSVIERDTQSAVAVMRNLGEATATGEVSVEGLLCSNKADIEVERPALMYLELTKQELNVQSLWNALQRSECVHAPCDARHRNMCDDALRRVDEAQPTEGEDADALPFDALLRYATVLGMSLTTVELARSMNRAQVPISLHGVTKLVKSAVSQVDFWCLWAATWMCTRSPRGVKVLELSSETTRRQESAARLRFGIPETAPLPTTLTNHYVCMECNGHDRVKAVLLSAQSPSQLPQADQKRISEDQCVNGVMAFGRRALAYDLKRRRYVCCRKRQCKVDKSHRQRQRCGHYPLIEVNLLGRMLCLTEYRYTLCSKCAAVCCCVRTPIISGHDVLCGQCAEHKEGGYKPLVFSQKCVHCDGTPSTDRVFNAVENLKAMNRPSHAGVHARGGNDGGRGKTKRCRSKTTLECGPKRQPGRALDVGAGSGRRPGSQLEASQGTFLWVLHDDVHPHYVALEWLCEACCRPWTHNRSWVWPKRFLFFGIANGLRERDAGAKDGGTLHSDKVYPSGMFAVM